MCDSIKNKPKINEDPKDAMLRELKEELDRLRAELSVFGMLCIAIFQLLADARL